MVRLDVRPILVREGRGRCIGRPSGRVERAGADEIGSPPSRGHGPGDCPRGARQSRREGLCQQAVPAPSRGASRGRGAAPGRGALSANATAAQSGWMDWIAERLPV
ncbi:hypothetical protein B9Y88_05165 [Stenotrophomonas maltophilia]|uniref:Uncharacterized protein n=1 Tax=Stenotrophomonas maltophilia TaxID=40324 RepID=A0AAW3S4X9_STEMA|nr:hypothetical protein [Stenotrophomonas maltophilia]TVS56991.1 hypothetical protein E2P66_05095 [Xanthomonas perforans]PJL78154.1 hypothetical protein B9Y88_05165 [Stenotrophomonas maltophilia]QGL82507.1 hypothetical protein FEO94_06010 [Stenotrophomonas maltophilia]TNY02168.1 hypothetical protein FIU09_01625 [Stenotrophomonas maltophilia]